MTPDSAPARWNGLLLPLFVTITYMAPAAAEAAEPAATASKPIIHIVPQSHIDVVWLWRFDPETIHRCCKPTFTRATDNMARFPEYTFNQSQAPLYEATERCYPQLYEKIEQYVREGRWEIVGGMYVEAEGGEPCGESLVRQCVMGKRFFREKFGIDVTTGWQEDAWSHPWQLPQILSKSGIKSYMFKRGKKGEDLFWWQSPDGSRVLGVNPFRHSAPPFQMWKDEVNSIPARYGVNDVMFMVGGGDHGGGLNEQDIRAIQVFARDVSTDADVKFTTFGQYVKTVLDQSPKLPAINDELGFELEGDLTGCSEIKKSNRECENLLLCAEKWAATASVLFSHEYPDAELETAWKKLLFNQFHDILGGSAIPPAVLDAMQDYLSIQESCEDVTRNALDAISHRIDTNGNGIPLVVFNALSWKRTDAVEAELTVPEETKTVSLKDAKGKDVPVQILDTRTDKSKRIVKLLFVAHDVPSCGYKTYFVHGEDAPPAEESSIPSGPPFVLENEFFRVELNPETGYLSHITDKKAKREILNGEGNVIVAISDDGDSEGRFVMGKDEAPFCPGEARDVCTPALVTVTGDGPVCKAVRIERSYQNSRFTQDIRLYAGVPRVDFRLSMDWHDVHTMVKVAFPLALNDPRVTYDGPYAPIVRPANGHEYPAQKWVDLSAGDYGVSLLNNARYAHDVKGHTVRMSILRSPTTPANNTDEGAHSLGYSLYAHGRPWQEAGVMQQGYGFNVPLRAFQAEAHAGALPPENSFFSVQPDDGVYLEAVKKAYDSDRLVLRLCEFRGKKTTVKIALPSEIKNAEETDLLEDPVAFMSDHAGSTVRAQFEPYEIKTLRIKFAHGF